MTKLPAATKSGKKEGAKERDKKENGVQRMI
jgi:hypothetical protein